MARGGEFEIEVRGPYPCWCELKHKGERLASFTHSELSDLEYAIKKAMQEARLKLGKDAGEV
jgi:hypothetical protein